MPVCGSIDLPDCGSSEVFGEVGVKSPSSSSKVWIIRAFFLALNGAIVERQVVDVDVGKKLQIRNSPSKLEKVPVDFQKLIIHGRTGLQGTRQAGDVGAYQLLSVPHVTSPPARFPKQLG